MVKWKNPETVVPGFFFLDWMNLFHLLSGQSWDAFRFFFDHGSHLAWHSIHRKKTKMQIRTSCIRAKDCRSHLPNTLHFSSPDVFGPHSWLRLLWLVHGWRAGSFAQGGELTLGSKVSGAALIIGVIDFMGDGCSSRLIVPSSLPPWASWRDWETDKKRFFSKTCLDCFYYEVFGSWFWPIFGFDIKIRALQKMTCPCPTGFGLA